MLIILPRADQLSSHPEPSALHWRAGHPPCSTTFNTRVPYCACLSFGKQICFILMILIMNPYETMPVLLGVANHNFSLGESCKHKRPRPRSRLCWDGQLSLSWALGVGLNSPILWHRDCSGRLRAHGKNLQHLKDLHGSDQGGGTMLIVFNRPIASNSIQ